MNCLHTQDNLSQLMDGELPASFEADVFLHLSGCEVCRAFFKNLLTLREELASARVPQVPASLDRRVLTASQSSRKAMRYISWIQPGRMYSFRAIGLAVLLSIVTTIFVSSFWYKNSQQQQTIVCLTPLPEVEVNGYVVVASSPTKGINQ
jgi:predicted anti-sigma-YlaC factor YlaD